MLSSFLDNIRERLSSLPPNTRIAWTWDIVTGLLAGIYQGSIWTFVQRIARADLHATGAQMAWIVAAPAVGYLFATLWARQMEGRAKMPFVFWTWLFARGLFMGAIFLPLTTPLPFVALVCCTPILFSVSTPAYTSIMKDIYPDRHRGRLMSVTRIGMNSCMFLSALVLGRLLDRGVDFRLVFVFGGACGAFSAWTFSRIPLPLPAAPVASAIRQSLPAFLKDTFGILRRNPGYRWFSASVFVSGFGNLTATTLYPIYQVDTFHITNTQVANLQNITALATIFGFFFWGTFLDRRGPLTSVLLAIGINLLVPLCYAVSQNISLLYLGAVAGGLAMAGVDLAYLNTTLLFAEPGKAAQYQALHSSFFGIRGTIAPHFAIPLMHAIGARSTFWISLAIMVAGVGLQMVSMRDYREQIKEEKRQAALAVKSS